MAELVSVIVGGVLALAGGVIVKFWEDRRGRRALAYAFVGEINAIVVMVEQRGYEKYLADLQKAVHATNEPLNPHVPVTQNYFVIYEANADKVGLLPRDAARDIALFYTQAKGLMEDVGENAAVPRTGQEALQKLGQMQAILGNIATVGKRVVERLENV